MSLGMLAIFFFAIMPHEFIHDEIARHKDTVDLHHSHELVSPHHIHCNFLQVVLAPYLPGHIETFQAIEVSFHISSKAALPFFSIETLFHIHLRGPPALI